MKCEIIFTVDGQTISLEVDSSTGLLSDNLIKGLQENNDKRIELYDALQQALYKVNTKSQKLNSLIKTEGLIGNTTSEQLAQQFGVDFPEDTNVEVLFVKGITVSGVQIYDRINTHDGREVFIIRDNGQTENEDINKLANFLKVRKLIEEEIFKFSEDSQEFKELKLCLESRNKKSNEITDIKDMLLEYIHNKNKYSKLVIKNEANEKVEVNTILDRIIRIINNYSQKVSYKNPFIDGLNKRSIYIKGTKLIKVDSLYDLLNIHNKKLINSLKLSSLKKFKNSFNKLDLSEIDIEKLKDEDIISIIKELQEIENPTFENVFQILIKNNPEFDYKYLKFENDKLYFKKIYHTLESKYGIGYDTLKLFKEVESYKGFKIYQWNDDGINKYNFSFEHVTPNSQDNIIEENSEEVIDIIKQKIDKIVSQQELYNNSLIQFKFRDIIDQNENETIYEDELSTYIVSVGKNLITKSIIDSLDVPIDKDTVIYNSEDSLFYPKQTLQDFYNIIKNWNVSDNTKQLIESKIDSPEKAITFIYKINEILKSERSNDNKIQEIVSQIHNAPIRSYFIQQYRGSSEFGNRYKIIPTLPNLVKQSRTEPHIPMVQLVQSISQVFKQKFNVQVEALTSSEISEKFKEIDSNTSKAFIRNGIIYINTTIADSSDLIHEYTHLLLGVLKSDPNLRQNYEQLMYLIASIDSNYLTQLEETYPNLSKIDLMEEMFVIKFSEYITKKITPNSTKLENIFKQSEKLLKKGTELIFNDNINNISDFYGKTLNEVFFRFSHDISQLLKSSKNLNFANTEIGRKYSNWIQKQIETKKIEENCK